MKNYSKTFIKGTFIVLVFSIVSTLIGYTSKLALAQTTSVKDIGLFFSVLSFVVFFSFFRDLGLSDSLVYFIPKFFVEKSRAKIKSSIMFTLYVQLTMGSLFFIVVSFLSKFLADNYFKDVNAAPMVVLLAFYFILDGIHEVLMRVFHSYQEIFFQQALDFSFQVFSFIFMMIVIYFSLPVFYFGLAYIIGELITVLIFSTIFLKKVDPKFIGIKSKVFGKINRPLLENSIPTMLGTIAESGFTNQTILFLTLFVNLESVGYYFLIRSIAKLSVFIYKASSRAFMPMISELWKRKDLVKLNSLFKEHMTFNYIIAAPVSVSLVFFSEEVLRLLYGEKFVVASNILKISAVYILFELSNNLITSIFTGIGRPKLSRNAAYLKLIVNLLCNLVLIPAYGLVGAVVSDSAAIFSVLLYVLYINMKELRLQLPLRNLSLIFLSTSVFLFEIVLLKKFLALNPYLEAIVILFVSGVSYVLACFLLRVISFDKIDYLLKTVTNNKLSLARFYKFE